jgi:exodeoxyribonuclease-5
VGDLEFPELLNPIDDEPPATVILSVKRGPGGIVVRGVAHDNGEIVKVVRIIKRMELHGFEFARVIVNFVNYKAQQDVELIIHIESLIVEGPSIPQDRMKELFYSVERDYAYIRTKKKRYEAILSDPYFNAIQVKYAYAVTCHKSQGGQWSDVYIDQGYITKDKLGTDYYRWLYTALTRATKKVYLVNFTNDYFED